MQNPGLLASSVELTVSCPLETGSDESWLLYHFSKSTVKQLLRDVCFKVGAVVL